MRCGTAARADEPFAEPEFARRRRLALRNDQVSLFVPSPEDVVLRKLLWYRQGNAASTQQWRDVVGVLAVSRDLLDRAYLDGWARQLGVADLLARAVRDAQ